MLSRGTQAAAAKAIGCDFSIRSRPIAASDPGRSGHAELSALVGRPEESARKARG
jgi:hypothetical protein